jgi:hypothetical protein
MHPYGVHPKTDILKTNPKTQYPKTNTYPKLRPT